MGIDSEAKENVLLRYDASSYLQSIGVLINAKEVWGKQHILNPEELTSD